MISTDDDILKQAEMWRLEGRGVAMATVMETWGSAPRPVGSHLIIDQDGNFIEDQGKLINFQIGRDGYQYPFKMLHTLKKYTFTLDQQLN